MTFNKKISIGSSIQIDDADEKRCAGRNRSRDFCEHIEKRYGTYHCTLFGKEVDKGDDEDGNYIFVRCQQCLDAEATQEEAETNKIKRSDYFKDLLVRALEGVTAIYMNHGVCFDPVLFDEITDAVKGDK